MTPLPEKTCSIDKLITHPKLVAATLAGNKTQQRRNGVYGWPGETFTLDDSVFIITKLYKQRLGDMSDTEAKAEGYDSLDAYQALILRMHPNMQWQDDAEAWVHQFERQG